MFYEYSNVHRTFCAIWESVLFFMFRLWTIETSLSDRSFVITNVALILRILFSINGPRYSVSIKWPHDRSLISCQEHRQRHDAHFVKTRASDPFSHSASHLTELCSLLLQLCNEASRTVQSGMNHPVSVSSCIYYPPLVSRLICWLVHSPQLCPRDHEFICPTFEMRIGGT